jgi:transcriptional regulator with XRE-family HTH domain
MSQIFLPSNLRVLRKAQKISQEDLAKSLGISRNKIASYEGKGVEPKLELLLKLAAFFKVSVDDLVKSDLSDEDVRRAKQSNEQFSTTRQVDANGQNLNLKQIIDPKLINDFVKNNEQSFAILEGFRSFNRLKSRDQPENPEISNLFMVLDHVLNLNKNFVNTLKNYNLID